MSEYWKSTPKYWCKHCSVYVRDTKLERTNHESTGRHQSAIKRSLRDLHRSHEQEEREKERARREVERLNGVVSGGLSSTRAGPSATSAAPRGAYGDSGAPKAAAQTQRQTQLEQLSAMGVEIPTEYRPNMALAGEWTVTATRVVKDLADEAEDEKKTAQDDGPVEKRAKGVRKREGEETEEQKEEEDAIRSLFKKRKTWGGPKAMPEADAELDALLSGGLIPKKEEPEVKQEEKEEEEEEPGEPEAEAAPADVKIKPDPDEADNKPLADLPGDQAPAEAAAPAVVFKKRKPKNVRQK